MRRIVHAAHVIVLLLGFYVLCIGLLAALVAADVFVTRQAAASAALDREVVIAYVLTAVVAYIAVRGIFVSIRVRDRNLRGIAVSERDEPALWRHVEFLAREVGTRPPKRIYLVADVNASVWDNAHLLGLIPGQRRMKLGLPLLAGLTPAQFDAVVSHELGHFGNRDLRFGALDHRAAANVASAMSAARGRRLAKAGLRRGLWIPGHNTVEAMFDLYGRHVLAVTQAARRRQEYAADRVAADIAGHANAASALRELRVIATALDFYLDKYATVGLDRKLVPMPAELFGGFAAMLAEPERRKQLDDVRRNQVADPPAAFASHPPMHERIAAIEALPPDGRPADTSGARAMTLLANPSAVMTAVGPKLLGSDAAGAQAVDWDTLVTAASAARAARRSDPLRLVLAGMYGKPVSLGGLLDAIDAGRLDEILEELPASDGASAARITGPVAREAAKTSMTPMVRSWALAELASQGRVRWRHSWADSGGVLDIDAELSAGLSAALRALVALRPDARAMRRVVYPAGVAA